MPTFSRLTIAVVLGLGLGLGANGVRGDEQDIPVDQVPAAATAAVKAKFPGAQIKSAAKEVEDGKTVYEVSLTHDGRSVDVSVKADGTIVGVETEIKTSDLPTAVTKAVEAKYPKATVKKAEKVEEGGKVSYEVVITTSAGKSMEVVLDKDGKILEEEAKGKDKD